MERSEEKIVEYTSIIVDCLNQLLEKDNDFSLDTDELIEGENLSIFFHALSTVVPSHFFQILTGNKKSFLEFNHLANHLCFQYMTLKASKNKKAPN